MGRLKQPERVMSDFGSIDARSSIQGLQPAMVMYRDHLHYHPPQKTLSTEKSNK